MEFERVERMARPFVIEVGESETFLEKSLKQAKRHWSFKG